MPSPSWRSPCEKRGISDLCPIRVLQKLLITWLTGWQDAKLVREESALDLDTWQVMSFLRAVNKVCFTSEWPIHIISGSRGPPPSLKKQMDGRVIDRRRETVCVYKCLVCNSCLHVAVCSNWSRHALLIPQDCLCHSATAWPCHWQHFVLLFISIFFPPPFSWATC